MKTLRFSLGLSLALAILSTLLGCASGIASRIEEKATEFGQLDGYTQRHLREGKVEKDFTKDMVYIALGQASKIETHQAADGVVEVWIYRNITLPNTGGFRGLTYNTDITIAPGVDSQESTSRTEAESQISQTDNNINLNSGELADLPMGTLHIFFFKGRVYKMTMKT